MQAAVWSGAALAASKAVRAVAASARAGGCIEASSALVAAALAVLLSRLSPERPRLWIMLLCIGILSTVLAELQPASALLLN